MYFLNYETWKLTDKSTQILKQLSLRLKENDFG